MSALNGTFEVTLGWPAVIATLALCAGLATHRYFRNKRQISSTFHAQTGDNSDVTQVNTVNEKPRA